MRNTRLIWFAIGTATSAAFSVAAFFILKDATLVLDDSSTWVVVIDEPYNLAAYAGDVEFSQEDHVASRTGSLLRECAAKVFEVKPQLAGSVGRPPAAEFPMVQENNHSLKCVLDGIQEKNFEYEIESRWYVGAVDELRGDQ